MKERLWTRETGRILLSFPRDGSSNQRGKGLGRGEHYCQRRLIHIDKQSISIRTIVVPGERVTKRKVWVGPETRKR